MPQSQLRKPEGLRLKKINPIQQLAEKSADQVMRIKVKKLGAKK